jgi:hypothetical protein
MSLSTITPQERFYEFQSFVGKQCVSLGDIEWSDLDEFLDRLASNIEQIDFLEFISHLPDNGVANGIIVNPTVHNRNQNELLMPIRKKQKVLLSQHFDLQSIVRKADQIKDHGEALVYLWDVLNGYDKYHPCLRNSSYLPEQLSFCNGMKLQISRRESLQRADFAKKPTQIMRDVYNVGQAGAVGANSKAENITFNQIWNQLSESPNLSELSHELSVLRQEMRRGATETRHDIAISEIAQAEESAKEGNGPKTLEHLKSAGQWALDVATKIGVSVAAKVIEQALNGNNS